MPAGLVWWENLFLTTTATQLGRGLRQEKPTRPAAKKSFSAAKKKPPGRPPDFGVQIGHPAATKHPTGPASI